MQSPTYHFLFYYQFQASDSFHHGLLLLSQVLHPLGVLCNLVAVGDQAIVRPRPYAGAV